tara:strand:+ start:434 stop:1183 length:750 start_codon:yes stop_codon:yes gene_type:complete
MPKRKFNEINNSRSKSRTGYFGITKNSQSFAASISIRNRWIHLGSYKTILQAAIAYDNEATRLRRPLDSLNFPDQVPAGYTPKQIPLQYNNTSGYRGVSQIGKYFRVTINIKNDQCRLGTFDNAKDGAIAYDRAVLKHNRSTTLLNFPGMKHNLEVEPKRKKYNRSNTGYKGIKQAGNFWIARIGMNGKMKHLGSFDTAIDAAIAYDQAAIKKGNKKSSLNFPDGLPKLRGSRRDSRGKGAPRKKIIYV